MLFRYFILRWNHFSSKPTTHAGTVKTWKVTFTLPISVMTVNVVFGVRRNVWFQHIKLALHGRSGAAEH
jgi:hypothetical protein